MIKTIIIRPEEAEASVESYKSVFRAKFCTWIDEAFDKGCLIKVLSVDFYNKAFDTNQYCAIEFTAIANQTHLEMLERLSIGL